MDSSLLSCSICNKKPRFSDLSHLLTHIASKAHVANYFKLQVKSRHDSNALKAMTDYDQWYHNHGLAKLLSDRMATASKTSRKRRSSRRIETSGSTKTDSVDYDQGFSQFWDDAVEDRQSPQWPSFEDNIDPRLSGLGSEKNPLVKTEPDLHSWKDSQADRSEKTRSPQNTPVGGKARRASCSVVPTLQPSLPSTPSLPDSKLMVAEPKIDEMTRLKGIQWPGMDLFDAATEPMKRQRNQKKDESTFKAMERASTATEPNEMVFSPSGTLRKEREITGYVEDDDPLPGEWRIPKPRRERRDSRDHRDQRTNEKESNLNKCASRQRKRVPLLASDPNRAVLGSRVTKKGLRPKRQMPPEREVSKTALTCMASTKQNLNHAHGHTRLTTDENDDLQLSMDTAGQSRASRLQIFRDDSPPETVSGNNHFISSLIDDAAPHSEPFEMPYLAQASDVINGLLASSDHEHFPTSFQQSHPGSNHGYSQAYENTPGSASRNLEAMYLVDPAGGPACRGPYDPLIGGNVLHYRWDWHEPELSRDDSTIYNRALGGELDYSRPPSTGSTIYEDAAESKNRLWLDGCCT